MSDPVPASYVHRVKKKPYYVVVDVDNVGMVVTGGGLEKPRGGWLARGSWITLFPSKRQAQDAIKRTRWFAKTNGMPWLKNIKNYRVVAVKMARVSR